LENAMKGIGAIGGVAVLMAGSFLFGTVYTSEKDSERERCAELARAVVEGKDAQSTFLTAYHERCERGR
jgi:hypothetical protein